MIARALLALGLALSLAACAGAAQQDAATQPAKPKPALRTGGPQPAQRVEDARCRIDADCRTRTDCAEKECRCVHDKCIRLEPALDPVIDPAPPASVR